MEEKWVMFNFHLCIYFKVTNAIKNSLLYNPSGQPKDGPMGISIALSPTQGSPTFSKTAITNASFRTKRLPGKVSAHCKRACLYLIANVTILKSVSGIYILVTNSKEVDHAVQWKVIKSQFESQRPLRHLSSSQLIPQVILFTYTLPCCHQLWEKAS